MVSDKLKIYRMAAGFSHQEMADELGLCVSSYAKKESGVIKFTDSEKVKVVNKLGMDYDAFNAVFYKGQLPFKGKINE